MIASWPRRALMGLVRAYRLLLSPWLGSSCRFEPTCSLYALEALDRHGAVAGSLLTLGRIGRCHPWCAGGYDPVPSVRLPLFNFLSTSRHPGAVQPTPGQPDRSSRS